MPRTLLVLVAAVVVALPGGCTTVVTGTPAADPAAGPAQAAVGDPVAWADQVCGGLLGFTDAATRQPDLTSEDPQVLIDGLVTYLGSVETAVAGAITTLDQAGPAPVDGGAEITTELRGTLDQVLTGFRSARTALEGVDASDPAAAAQALPAALAPLQELTALDPAAELDASPELNAAVEQAANCQALQAQTGG